MLQQLLEGDNTLNGNERVGIHFLAPGPEDTASHTPISPDSSIGSTPKVPVENTKSGTKISTQLNPSSPAPNGRREHVKPFKLYNDAMTIQYIVPINQIAEETVGSHECREHELTPVWVRQAEAALDEYPTFYVCENYLHFRTCPSGSRCSQVHISTNNANITRVPIHVNRPESLKKHTSLQAGKQITVFDRATGRSQTYGTENVLCTKGSSDWVAGYHCGRRVYHCKHFFRMSLCTRAEQCAFIHVVGTHRNTANTGFSQHQAQIYQYPSGTTSQPHIITNADMFNTTQLQFLRAQQNKLVNSAISNDRTSSLPAAPFFSNSHPLINQLTVPFLTGPNALSVQQPQITQPYLTNYQVNRATNGYSIVPTQSSVTSNSMQSLIPLYGFQSNDGKVETTNSTSQITSSATSNLGGGMFSNTTNSNVNNANTTTQSNPSISQGQIPAVASNLPTSQSTSNSQILYAVPMQQSSQPTNGTGMDTWILNPNSVQQQQQQQLVYILVPGMNVSQ